MKKLDYTNFNNTGHYIAICFIIAASLCIQLKFMNEFPAYIHAWAQDDRYAIALGFLDNNFDLFHPESMIYNKQFPSWWEEASSSTITAVDFPIHEYIVALWMKLTGDTSPWVFRLWTYICSLIGMFFLYKSAFLLTKDWIKSIFATVIAITAPVYAYYFNGFLPGIPAFALGVTGLWAFLKYREDNNKKYFHIGIALITIATLIRTTFVIELITIFSYEFLRILHRESSWKDKIPSVLLSAGAIVAYLLWNNHLRALYGSLFLNELMPPKNWDEAWEILNTAKENWLYHYFQKSQYFVFALTAVAAILTALFRILFKKKEKISGENTPQKLSIWWMPSIYLIGCLMFTVAMMVQLINHDYYFIDTFFLPVLLTFILLESSLPPIQNFRQAIIPGLTVMVLSVLMILKVNDMQTIRRDINDRAYQCYLNFSDSDSFLDSLSIPQDVKILSLYAYPQNGSFIQMRRKGFSIMKHKTNLIEAIDHWDIDYVVIENHIIQEQFEERKEILGRLCHIADNGHISVCTLCDTLVCHSADEFFEKR